MTDYRLTQYSHGAGCGCKISPATLSEILGATDHSLQGEFAELLVGNLEKDDAAVFDLGDGTAIVSTTDFFMPIVDDPQSFGWIAAANAMSDIYAMGGNPMMAIAILGWPINVLPAAVASEVLKGAQQACREAKIPLAGGHSIDSPEPIFGLAVTGRVDIPNLKRNACAKPGDLLYLTKPLGVGILSTAQKRGISTPKDDFMAESSMKALNTIGYALGKIPGVHAMTDVTGFGLGGHLSEMCEASNVSAVLDLERLPLLDQSAIEKYIEDGCIPGGTHRNFDSYGHLIADMTVRTKAIVCDPQTSGGLLVAVDPSAAAALHQCLTDHALESAPIGKMVPSADDLRITFL